MSRALRVARRDTFERKRMFCVATVDAPAVLTVSGAERRAQQELAAWLVEDGGYRAARVLPDGSIAALLDLAFTRAICLGVTRWGWENRFCFEDRALADRRFAALESEDDEPAGYTERRTA
jgi:hypothetical protein